MCQEKKHINFQILGCRFVALKDANATPVIPKFAQVFRLYSLMNVSWWCIIYLVNSNYYLNFFSGGANNGRMVRLCAAEKKSRWWSETGTIWYCSFLDTQCAGSFEIHIKFYFFNRSRKKSFFYCFFFYRITQYMWAKETLIRQIMRRDFWPWKRTVIFNGRPKKKLIEFFTFWFFFVFFLVAY